MRTRTRPVPRIIAIAVLFGITACAADAPSATPNYSVAPPEPGDEAAAAAWQVAGSGDPGDSPIQEMWRETLRALVPAFAAPRAVIPYRPGDVPPIACADQQPASAWVDNAFYCAIDETIAYDEAFVHGLADRTDPSAVRAILAHEWGHHVQHVLDESGFSIQDELQADCYAGMFASRQDLESDDVTASVGSAEAFYELGNAEYASSRWFSTGEHGSPRQRLAAWSLGYQALQLGFELCRGYGEWEPGRAVDIGPYRFVELPGRPGTLRAARYELDASGLPPARIEHLALPPSAPDTPAKALLALIEDRFGQRLGALDGPHATERPDEAAFLYYAADADAARGVFTTHGILGLQLSPADPGRALVVDVPAPGSAPMSGPADAEAARGVEDAFLMAAMILERVCAPHHTTDAGPPETHNEMCYPDL